VVRTAHKISAGQPEGKGPPWNLRIDMRIILKWILKKEGVRMRIELILIRIRSSDGLL